MYRIGEFSKLCRVPVKTLRFYDAQGLLRPQHIDGETGYRYYAPEQAERCHRILALKELGFQLGEIRRYLDAGSPEELMDMLRAKRDWLQQEQENIAGRLSRLTLRMSQMTKEETGVFDIVCRPAREFWIAGVRNLYDSSDQAAGERKRVCESSRSQSGGIVMRYDLEYMERDFDLAVGVPLEGLPADKTWDRFRVGDRRPGCRSAALFCSPEQLESAYSAMQAYVQSNRLQVVGAYYEIYHDEQTIELSAPVCPLSPTALPPRRDPLPDRFEDDPAVIGRWTLVDCLPSKEQFCPRRSKFADFMDLKVKELYFLPGGEWYWCFGWTKGALLSRFGYPSEQGVNPYEIERLDGKEYLFVEMKMGDYFRWGGQPEIWVLERADALRHTTEEIRLRDDTDLPFQDDPGLAGVWEACDLVRCRADFDPEHPNPVFPPEALFWKRVEFDPTGGCRVTYGDKALGPPQMGWTKGWVLNHASFLAEQYVRERIGGREYLFCQWKSGDYYYGRQEPDWYVFRRGEG